MALARRNIGRLASLALVAGTLVVATGTGAAQAADAVDGGLSAGDTLFPNQGNTGYDALHYDIDLAVDVAVSRTNNAVAATTFRTATTAVTARTTGAPLRSYAFDFQGSATDLASATLIVDSVTVDGAPATFRRIENTTTPDATTDVHKIVVTPAAPVDGEFTTVVTYHGAPVRHTDTDGSSEGWNNTRDGATFLNQPVGSMTAFPNNNTPRDKATYSISLDVPSKLTTSSTAASANPGLRDAAAVSNGELTSKTPSADGSRTTWVWDQKKPMASELTLISIGRYDTYESDIALSSGRTIHEWSFIDPSIPATNQQRTQTTRGQVPAILNFLESKYGPYPGNSTGLVTDIVPGSINYALETQDRSFFPTQASLGTTIHEIMHQWFGDNVSPVDWNDIWLNEGPATYAEFQVPAEGLGTEATDTETQIFDFWNEYPEGEDMWTVPTAGMSEASELFGAQVYDRGAMTLEALRTSIGAADFATVMKQWQARYAGTSKRTADFIALAEEISGRDLEQFFETWIYTTGKPAWPAKFDLSLTGPEQTPMPRETAAFSVKSTNTGKVTQTGSVVTVDVSTVLASATLGTLPDGTVLDGSTLTWTVPSIPVGDSASISIPFTVKPGTVGATVGAVARASTLGSTCVDCASTFVVTTKPIEPAPSPTITGGPAVVGKPLGVDTAGWLAGTTFTYQWFVGASPVDGATAATFTPAGSALGQAVRVKVTGSNGDFTPVTRTSEPTAGVAAGDLVATPVPTIEGTAKVGVELTAVPGTWDDGTTLTYQWSVDGAAVKDATGATYTPTPGTLGDAVTVDVTGTRTGYKTVTKASEPTADVVAGDLDATPVPTVSGTPQVGRVVTAVPGSWDDGTTLSYQWLRDGKPIAGATGASHVLVAADRHTRISVVVTGSKRGYTSVSRTSRATHVKTGVQSRRPVPAIQGAAKVHHTLKVKKATYDAGVSLTYTWYVDGRRVGGSNSSRLKISTAYKGKRIAVRVTARKPGYVNWTSRSDKTARVR